MELAPILAGSVSVDKTLALPCARAKTSVPTEHLTDGEEE